MGSVQNSFCFWLKFIKDQFSPEGRLWRDTEAPLLLFTSLISVSETHVQASLSYPEQGSEPGSLLAQSIVPFTEALPAGKHPLSFSLSQNKELTKATHNRKFVLLPFVSWHRQQHNSNYCQSGFAHKPQTQTLIISAQRQLLSAIVKKISVI